MSKSPGDPRYVRARYRQFLGGFSAGGPVWLPRLCNGRNRTSVFGAFEHYTQERYQLSQDYIATVPIPEFLEGNFSKLLTTTVVGKDALGRDVLAGQIFDPKTMRREGARWVSEPFIGNIIPKSRMSALSSKIIDIYQKSYLPMIPDRVNFQYELTPDFLGANRGSSRYDSFQLQLTKRMSHGVAAQALYNLSKAVGNVETAFDETWDATAGIQDMHDLKMEANTVLSYDQRHILKGYIQWQLPFGRGRRYLNAAPAWLSALAGGWDLTWLFKYNTGTPLGITPNVWYPGWDGAVHADWDRSVDLSRKFNTKVFNPGRSNDPVNQYFDQSAFSDPKPFKLGNGRRRYNELRGFGRSSESIGLLKYFRFTENVSLQVRAELLNVFNRHHFANPGTVLANRALFGFVTGMTGDPRNIQVGLRLGW